MANATNATGSDQTETQKNMAFCRTGISANGKKTPRKATKGTAGKKDYK